MYKHSSNFSVACFRSRILAWILLTTLVVSFMPSVSLAQQPTAIITDVSGTVFVNGQQEGKGAVLTVGDLIETQAGASVVLELSDGSQLELGENTRLNVTELSQAASGARTSYVKMLWGRIRAQLSPGHQQAGSSFNIETPNALVGVKFSQPDVEVQYDLQTAETTALALTVALLVRNLLTGEEQLIPVGSTAIVTALGIKVIAGIVSSGGSIGAGTTATKAGGVSATKMLVIGAGAAVALGGAAALALSSSDGDGDGDKNGSSGEIPVDQAQPSDFFGQYEGIDPGRSYDEYHADLNFMSNMSFTYTEWYEGISVSGTGSWSFDRNSRIFSLRSDAGAELSGTISGTTYNFTLSGRWSDGRPGTIILTRK